MSVLMPLYVYLSFGILQIRLLIHEGQTPPGPNRDLFCFLFSVFSFILVLSEFYPVFIERRIIFKGFKDLEGPLRREALWEG